MNQKAIVLVPTRTELDECADMGVVWRDVSVDRHADIVMFN